MLKSVRANYWLHRPPDGRANLTASPQQADLFLIPLLDGKFCLGQVVDVISDTDVLCALTDRIMEKDGPFESVSLSEVKSLLAVETSAFASGNWPIVGLETLPNINSIFNWRDAKVSGYQKIETQDAAVIEAFVNAKVGLYPWDGFGSADFFTRFLLDPTITPSKASMTADMEQAQ